MKCIPIGEVVRMTGLSRSYIALLDGELNPDRTAAGHRRYSFEDVQAFIAKRAEGSK